MIPTDISDRVVTIGPDPSGKGGIASVVQYYRDEIFPIWHFIPEASAGGGKLSKLADAVRACFKLYTFLRKSRHADIVHLHTAGKISFPRSCVFMRISRAMGRKVVMHMHSGTFPAYSAGKEKKIGAALSQADAVVVLSDTWRRYYTDTFGLDNVRVVPNIVPSAGVVDLTPRERDDTVHALFLGQLVDTKGIYDLLRAVAAAGDKLRGRFMLHVGGIGDTARFNTELSHLGIEDMVVYEGWVTSEKKKELLSISSISVLPSYFEGLPISLLEGMAYRHALIATDVGAIPDLLDGSNGALVTAGDIGAISAALLSMVSDRAALKAKGDVSYAKVKPYLPENVASELSSLYEELLADGKSNN